MYGTQEWHLLIRHLVCLKIASNANFYDPNSPKYIDPVQDYKVALAIYDKLLRNAATSGSYTDMMHVFAASTVINAPIRSYCPPSVHPEFVSDPLTRIVCGRGVRRFKDLREQHYCTKQSQLNSVKLKI